MTAKKTDAKTKSTKKRSGLKVVSINFVETPDASTRLAKVFDLLLGNTLIADRSSNEKR